MKKVLLAGDTPFFNDHIGFLFKVNGFELVRVRNLEEAINMIEINRSLLSNFDLLITEASELNDGTREYFRFFSSLFGDVKLLLIRGSGMETQYPSAMRSLLGAENVFHCTIENLVPTARQLLQEEFAEGLSREPN